MSSEAVSSLSERFTAERERLGYRNAGALGKALGFSQQAVSKIETSGSKPGGDLLAAFARAGADVHFVLTGERRVGLIDGTTYGMCEVAVVSAYAALRPGAAVPTAVRSGPVVQVYNRVMLSPRASVDLPGAVREMAELMISSLHDPLDPSHLERNLFRQQLDAGSGSAHATGQSGGVAITGNVSGGRIAGRNFVRIGGDKDED